MTDYALELDDTAVRRFLAAARLAERAERDQWTDAGITGGATVADVGCGPGAVTVLLGQRVEPGGRVAGIDSDPPVHGLPGQPGNDVSAGLGLADLLSRGGLELADFRGRYDIFCEKGFRGPAWEARDAMSAAGFARPEDLMGWQEAFERIDQKEDPLTLFLPVFTALARLPG